ncbi:zinc knuckle [Ostertagia ostertagi]
MPDSDKNQYCKIVEQLRGHFESPHFRSSSATQRLQTRAIGVRTQLTPHFDEAVVKAITYESLLADAANAITIFPPVQAPTPVVHAVQAQRGNFRGPAQYYQRRPNFANRQLSASPHQRGTFNRRAMERAPNSDVTCFRCGRTGHIQTFCRYDLPPAHLAPPRPFYRSGNRRPNNLGQRQQQGPWSGRRPLDNQRWNNNNKVQLTNPSIFRQPASRSQPKVFALEPTDDTTPVDERPTEGCPHRSSHREEQRVGGLSVRNPRP